MSEIIGLASDHGGKILKHRIEEYLSSRGYEVKDYGVAIDESASVDYPDYGGPLASDISSGKISRGIAVCGSGIGMSIVGNKYQNVRATLVWSEYTAKVSRLHNNSNLLCLGERVLNHDRALDYLKIWLDTGFEDRHQRRLEKINSIEKC